MTRRSIYSKMEIHAWPKSAQNEFFQPTDRQYLAKTVPYEERSFNLDSLDITANQGYWINFRGVTKGGKTGPFNEEAQSFNKLPQLNERPIAFIRADATTAVGSETKIGHSSIAHDPFTMYDTTDKEFIVPVAGLYRLSFCLLIGGSGSRTVDAEIQVSYGLGPTPTWFVITIDKIYTDEDTKTINGFTILNLAAGDNVALGIRKAAGDGTHATAPTTSTYSLEFIAQQ